jgi:transcription antitermination factor NusA-like protein
MSDVFAEYGGLITVGAIAASLVFIKFAFLSNNTLPVAEEPVKQSQPKGKSARKAAKKAAAKVSTVVTAEKTEAEKQKAAKEKAKAKARKARRKAEKEQEEESTTTASSENTEAKAAGKKKKKNRKKKPKKVEAEVETKADVDDVSEDDDDSWTTVQISSTRKSKPADDATGEDGEEVSSGPAKNVENFEIDTKYYGRISGDKGANLNALQDFFNVEINIPGKRDSTRFVSISGNAVDILATKNQIDQLIEKGYSKVTHPDTVDSHIIVPASDRKLLFGKGGSNIKAIQNATETRIELPDRSSTSEKVTIVGKKDGVKRCKLLIRELISSGFCEVTHPGLMKKEVPFPFDKVALLVGPNGHTIKSIQGNTKTKINTPKQLGMPLIIIGTAEDIFAAEREIQNVLNPPVITLQDLATQTNNPWARVEEYGNWSYDSIEVSA